MSFTTMLTERASAILEKRTNRRGFLNRAALVGSAVATTGVTYALKPTSAYSAVCGCNGRTCNCTDLCCDGYTEFCCQVYGSNSCPPNSILAGWWKVDNSDFCNGAARYYMDCNKSSPGCGCGSTGVCRDGTPCRCRSCGNRKDGCTVFRYGNCNNHVSCVGPILCRVVTCSKPWEIDPGCSTVSRTDSATRWHHRPCLDSATIRPRLDVFAVGEDRRVWQRYFQNGSGWQAWGTLGGVIGGGVRTIERSGGAQNRSDGKIDLFATSPNGHLIQRYWRAGSGWSPWGDRGIPPQRLTSTPGVCFREGGNRIDVFAPSRAGNLWQRYWRAGIGWSGWRNLGGAVTGGVDAIARDDGKIDVFVVASGGRLMQRYWRAGGDWSPWVDLGRPGSERFVSSPGVCFRREGDRIDIFAATSGGRVWQRYWQSNNGWSGWRNLGGSAAGGVSAIAKGDNALYVFAVGPDGRLRQRSWRAGVDWSSWTNRGRPPSPLTPG